MARYILRRMVQAIPTLIGISVISFMLVNLSPGDPILIRTFDPSVTQETREIMRRQLGLDQPLFIQYIRWMTGYSFRSGDWAEEMTLRQTTCSHVSALNLTICDSGAGVLRGDLGTSIQTQQPVWARLVERMPATIQLGATSLIVSLLLGVPLGVLSAVYRGSIFDNMVRVLAVIGQAVPGFWLGLMMIFIFGVILGWLPTGGRFPSEAALTGKVSPIDWVSHTILPALVLGFGGIAGLSRIMRTETLEVIHTDYIRTARAKGLIENRVYFVHALRNALLPLMTILGPAVLGVVSGAVITETVFTWPGMGRLTFNAALQRDYPMVLGAVMFFSVLVVLGNLLSDILYGIVDPRVRLS